MIEMEDLLAKVRVFEQRRTARTLLERVLIIRDGRALLRGEDVITIIRALVRLAAIALPNGLVAIGRFAADGLACFCHTESLRAHHASQRDKLGYWDSFRPRALHRRCRPQHAW